MNSPALRVGDYRSLDAGSAEAQANCFIYERQAGDRRALVALNFSREEQHLSFPDMGTGTIVLSTDLDREGEVDLTHLNLRANEGCIIEL